MVGEGRGQGKARKRLDERSNPEGSGVEQLSWKGGWYGLPQVIKQKDNVSRERGEREAVRESVHVRRQMCSHCRMAVLVVCARMRPLRCVCLCVRLRVCMFVFVC
eukprot:714550-Pleurochrysis_carterae.AAC.3